LRVFLNRRPLLTVMITQAEFDALLQRYLDGRSQPGEQQLVEQWSAQLGQEENLLLHPSLHQEVRTAMWHRIVQLTEGDEVPEQAESKVIQRPLTFWREPTLRWAAAAMLVLGGVGAGWWLPQHTFTQVAKTTTSAPKWVRRTNTKLPQETIHLADGSLVTLYAGSSLKYQEGVASKRREVYLVGQAFFKVAKNPARPFLVYTDKLVTTVLGTSFLVTAYTDKKSRVSVREGRVSVQAREGAELSATPAHPAATGVLLLPNQQVTYATGKEHLRKALVEKPMPLTSQLLSFKNKPVMEVLTALEHAYGVNIVYDPLRLSNCTITISFSDESLFEQLDVLCKALNGKYRMANDAQIIFDINDCQAHTSASRRLPTYGSYPG
jgi:transmembrane sensor